MADFVSSVNCKFKRIFMKRDIAGRHDIERLINAFYDKVKHDDVIGYIFNDVAKVNWVQHLPVMYDFWESLIFLSHKYTGNAMAVHLQLHQLTGFTKEHFSRWLQLFTGTVDDLFEGKKAAMAKEKAAGIAAIMETKMIAY